MKTRNDPSTKPYFKCLSCPSFRNTCPGIPTRDMDMAAWCEYVRDVMDVFHLSNAYVAEKAEASLKTVERIRACNIDQDIMRGTTRRVERVVFGTVARHFCDLDFNVGSATEKINSLQAEVAALKEEVAYWRKENDRKAKFIDKYLE